MPKKVKKNRYLGKIKCASSLTQNLEGGGGLDDQEDDQQRQTIIPRHLRPFLERINSNCLRVKQGFVKNMRTDAICFCNDELLIQLLEEMEEQGKGGGFVPALKQIANVASLPGIVGCSVGMPDIHSGYGFAVGNVAAMDMDEPGAVVSPGGVGFDINCGVRLIRTNLVEDDLKGGVKDDLCSRLFKAVPVGVGADGVLSANTKDLDEILNRGMSFLVDKELAWAEDLTHVEGGGCLPGASADAVSQRAKKRGVMQVGSLGSGNHYCEVQIVDEIFSPEAAAAMNLARNQVVVMVHCGSRGLGHQVCTDYLQEIDRFSRDLNDRQLACCPIDSPVGARYLAAMKAAANYAFVNRGILTHVIRETFSKYFKTSARDLGMHVIYDVCHNIAKEETHVIDGVTKRVLVHRKGATRAFPPHHPEIPEQYKEIGQPVIVGGSMGTCSYILTGVRHDSSLIPADEKVTPKEDAPKSLESSSSSSASSSAAAMKEEDETEQNTKKKEEKEPTTTNNKNDDEENDDESDDEEDDSPTEEIKSAPNPFSFYSTCHGAGRSLSRSSALKSLSSHKIFDFMASKGISVFISTPKLIAEEAKEAYKDVDQVVKVCEGGGLSKMAVRLRPVAVIKG